MFYRPPRLNSRDQDVDGWAGWCSLVAAYPESWMIPKLEHNGIWTGMLGMLCDDSIPQRRRHASVQFTGGSCTFVPLCVNVNCSGDDG